MSPLLFGLTIFLSVLFIAGVYYFLRFLRHRRFKRDLDLRLLAIRLPLKNSGDSGVENKKDPIAEIAYTAQLLSSLVNTEASFSLEVAVHNVGEEIIFYLAVPKKIVEFTKRQIEGLWGGAQIDFVSQDYTIFNSGGDVQLATLKLKKHFALPVRSYVDVELDTFATILSNFSKINAVGEGLALQLVVKPVSKEAKKKISKAIIELKKGEKIKDVLEPKFFDFLGKQSFKNKKDKEDKPEEPKIIDEEAVKSLEQKISKPLFAVNVRVCASSPTPYRTSELLEGVLGSFAQFEAPLRNEFKIVNLSNSKSGLFKFIFREFEEGSAMILNADEVTSIFHFPISSTDIPRVKSVRSAESAPPVAMPKSGTLIGESNFRGEHKPVYITEDDRRRHLYVIGQTGTGKSVFLKNLAIEDIKSGKGMAFIDPHGDTVDDLLALIPKERYDDVIIFDPGDRMYPLGLNMLEYDFNFPEQKTFIVNEMLSILFKLFPDSGEALGPMFQQYLRNALLLLLEDAPNEPATMMEIPRVFTDAEFRKRKLARITNPVVIDFWEKEATKVSGEASLANMTPYITSKFGQFIANDYLRPIIGQYKSAFNFRKIMDEGKILLVNLSKGRIGELNANLIGMVIVGKFLMAALSRVDIDQEKRHDFNLFIDEFQNVTTSSIATILSEARKYRLSLVVAHQFIAQLQEDIRDAVFGNVGSIASFRIGADDAEFLVKQFEPIFTKNDLMNLDNFNAYVKLLIAGQTSKPFNIKTIRPPIGNAEVKNALKDLSRHTYGADRTEIEADIVRRLRE